MLAHPGVRRLHRRGAVRRSRVAVPSTSGSPGLTDGEGSGWDMEGAATGAGTSKRATPAPARGCTTVSSGCPINSSEPRSDARGGTLKEVQRV